MTARAGSPSALLRWGRTLLVMGLALGLFAVSLPASSRAEPIVPFGARFSTDDNGTIAIFGNNLLTCPAADARCAGAQAGTQALNNNSFVMANLDVDGVAGTFNSSSVQVIAPPNGEVLWAGLYWGAKTSRGVGGVAGVGDRRTMSLRVPGAAGYASVSSQVAFGPTSDGAYQEFADVTAQVRSAGAGTYWGANVVAGTGEDRYAGWSLVVVFRAPDLPLRSLTVFDGFSDVGRDDPQLISISGFRTPVSGPVATQLGMIAYEGDFSTSGDTARLNATQLSTTPLSRGSNFFNGTNDSNGASVQTRSPAHLNMLGYDVKNLAATGIPNGATSATISLESTGDRYLPGVVTTAIRLFAPDFTTSTKTVANLAGRTPALPGDTLEYTITYPNTGQDAAVGAVMTDTLPAGTTFESADPSSGSCTGSGSTVSCTIGTIGVGATWQTTVRALVGPGAGGTTLRNAAVLNYTAQTLARPLTYVVAPAVIDVGTIADLSLTKTVTPEEAFAGDEVTSTLTVSNAGPNTAADTVVTDQLPAGTTFVSATSDQGTCTEAAGVVTCALGSVADGASVGITVVVAVPSGSTAASVVNVASVASSTADPNPADNSAGGSAAVSRAADLAVTKTADTATVVPGDTVTYTVTATNNGPSDAVDVTVSDALQDTSAAITSATAPGATCTVTADAARCSQPALTPGASITMTVTARVSPDAPAGTPIVNTATASSSTADPDESDNAAEATVTTTAPQADLATTKTSSAAIAGGQVTYTIVASNNGPSTAFDAQISDTLPPGVTATGATSSRGTCTVGATVTCDLGTLPGPDAAGVLSSAAITIVADVAPDVPAGALRNTAVASTSTADPVPANEAAFVDTAVAASADITVAKTASPVQPVAGQDVTFTVTIGNAGPSFAREVSLSDALPPGLTLLGVDPPAGITCATAAVVTCDIGTLPVGDTIVVDVRMSVPAGFDLNAGATNTATITSSTPDPSPQNDEASATITARAISDLLVVKWDTTPSPPAPGTPPRTFNAGETVTYYLAAGNAGPSDATTARVVDTLPDGVTFVSSVPQCAFAPPNQVVCDLPTLPSGSAAVFPITVTVDPDVIDGTQLTNSATITLTDPARVDPVSSNNFAVTSNPVATLADLVVAKQTYSLDLPAVQPVFPSSAPAGAPTGYLIDIRNDGPSIARDVILLDSSTMTDFHVGQIRLVRPGQDPEVSDITASCPFSGGDLQCPLGDIPVGALGWGVQVDGLTLSNAVPGSYVNTATLTSSTPELDDADNTAQAPITVTDPVATLTITKSVLGGSDVDGDADIDLVPGTPFGYQLSVENVFDLQREGASDAEGVVVTDTLPPGLVATAVTASQGTCEITPPRTVTCELGTVLGPGRVPAPPAVLITVTGTVSAAAAGTGPLTNTASVSSPISATATASVTQDVVAVADLSIVKVPDASEVPAGSLAGFSLIVTNAGPSDALDTEVGDLLPAEIAFDPASSDPACANVTIPEGTFVSCSIGTLGVGETRTVRVSGQVPSSQAPTTVTNVSAVSSPTTGEYDFTNNRSDAEITITQAADLVVTKTADAEAQAVGEQVTYSVSVTNAGPSDASDVVVSDPIPPGLALVSAAGDGLDCAFAGGIVTCTSPSLASGATASATLVIALPVGLEPGPVVNTVTAASATPDPTPANNTAQSVVDLFILADTAIEKSVLTPEPTAGRPVAFALDVTNRGPQSAPRVVVSDSLEPGTTLLSTVVPGGSCQVTHPEDLDVVTCEVGALAVGATARVVVTVMVGPEVTSIRNGGLVGSSALDEASADNYDEVVFDLALPTDPPPTPPPAPGAGPGGASGEGGLAGSGGGGPNVVLLAASAALVIAGSALAALARSRRRNDRRAA